MGLKILIGQLQIPTRRWQGPTKPGIKSILMLRLAIRRPSDGFFAKKNRVSRLFERIVLPQEGLCCHE